VIDDRWVSRRHCEIVKLDHAVAIRDLGSRHGTLVNDRKVDYAELRPGDKLQIGLTLFEVAVLRDERDGEPSGFDTNAVRQNSDHSVVV
jgi:pSer/pThr/pTyr-binding forkhead associated (FHA) protein